MKLTIEDGVPVSKAMKYLQNFLAERKKEYPLLMGEMSVYITLKSKNRMICPENEKEYLLTKDGLVDLYEEAKQELLHEIQESWGTFVSAVQRRVTRSEKAVALDYNYLATAAEKGKRSDLVEKRKKQLAKHEEELKKAVAYNDLVQELNELVENQKVIYHFIKRTYSDFYDYDLECCILFETSDEKYYTYYDEHGLETWWPDGCEYF